MWISIFLDDVVPVIGLYVNVLPSVCMDTLSAWQDADWAFHWTVKLRILSCILRRIIVFARDYCVWTLPSIDWIFTASELSKLLHSTY